MLTMTMTMCGMTHKPSVPSHTLLSVAGSPEKAVPSPERKTQVTKNDQI